MRRGLSVAFAGGLVLGFAAPAQAAFPGLNGKIAFERDCDFNEAVPRANGVCHSGVTTVNPDGSGLALLTRSSLSDDSPAWSADGKRLAFVRGVDGDSGNMQIWTMNADGTNQANLTSDPNLEDKHPAWSPDGTKIAFIRLGSEDQVWVMNSDGSGKHALTALPANSSGNTPNWSPDGSKIAFDRFDQGSGTNQIYVVNADGSGTPANLSNNSANDSEPNWSPDGSKIVFNRSGTSAGEIWVMSATGANQSRLTDASSCPVTGFSDSWPVFSPDGTMIAFARASCSTDDFTAIWVMRADGSGANKITTPPEPDDVEPDWQPVGRVESAAQIPPCLANGLVTVAVADFTGFKSPPRAVLYRLDFGAEQVALTNGATATIAVPAGRHELEFWGQNQAGDQEAAHHNVIVTVDAARPRVVILRDQGRSTFRRGQFASVTIKATDTGGAGLVRDPSRRRLRISTSSVGTKTVRATAVDACGNTATALLRYRVVRGAVANRRANRPRFTG